MPRPPRIHVPGRIHHVMARGNGGEAIVARDEEWRKLLDVIAGVKRTSDFALYAFCLMTNHFHLLVEVGNDPLSHIMHRIQTTWAKRFNIARRRRGHVFQDRFKSRPCDSDDYFRWLLRYIHLNPVKAGLVRSPEQWLWSSFRQYLGLEGGIADIAWPLSLFSSGREDARASFRDFVSTGIEETAEALPLSDSRASQDELDRRAAPADPPGVDELARRIASETGLPLAALLGPSRARGLCAARRLFARQALAGGHRAAEIARRLGVSPSAASRMSRDQGQKS